MDSNSRQIFEDELVMSKAISRPSDMVFDAVHQPTTINGQTAYEREETLVYNQKPLVNFSNTGLMGGFQTIFNTYSCGVTKEQKQFESVVCDFLQVPEILVFPSYEAICADFAANILNDTDTIIYDEYCTPSLMRGIRLSAAEKLRFGHNDMAKLEDKLKLSQMRRIRLIVTDGIFCDSGQCANLNAIKQLAEKYNALVVVDDSFGFLACGKNGRGSDEHCGIRGFADLKIVNLQSTLKATVGAFVCGDSTLIELLRRRSVSLRYSVSVQRGTLGTAAYNLQTFIESDVEREALRENVLRLYDTLREMGFNPERPCSNIVSFTTETSADRLREMFLERGWLCELYKRGAKTTAVFRVTSDTKF